MSEPANLMQKFGERMHRLIREAFDWGSLEMVFSYSSLNERLDGIAAAGQGFDAVVFRVVLWADQNGRMPELATVLAKAKPHRTDFTALCQEMNAHVAMPPVPLSIAASVPLPDALSAFIRGYERLRRVVPPSDQRTVMLEEMVTRIRAEELAPLGLPARFHLSPSEGERMAAIVALRERPDAAYLRWLPERIAVEESFAGYHAAAALAEAARRLPLADLELVADAVVDGLVWLNATPGRHSGRRDQLAEAQAALACR